VDDPAVGVGHLDAHGGGQAIAHGAEAARGHPAVGLVEVEVLGGPHLVLADLGGDVGVVAAGERIEPFYGVLRLDQLGVRPVGEALSGAPKVDLFPPVLQGRGVGLVTALFPHGDQVGQDTGRVPHDADVGADVLAD